LRCACTRASSSLASLAEMMLPSTSQVINDGELPLTFDWHTEEPFSVSPASATLEPGTSCPVTASFYPQAGTVFVSTAVCRVDGLEPREMKLTGVGKFTYLSASDTELDFGDVQTGNTSTRTITLRNQSLVNASFKIVNLDTNEGDIFAFSPTVGVIPPEETVDITIKFGPHCTGMYSSENFEVATPGGNTIQINCAGLSVGPDIHLSTHSMNFGDVVSGQSSSKSVRISNSSTMGADFQVLSEKDGVFKFERVEGIVPAELYPGKAGHIDVVISFSPEVPANYYKRVYILFKNQSPSYIDVFGTCYDTKIRPAPFSQRHIDAYRAREAAGDGCVAPDKLEEMDYAHNLALEATQDIDLSEDDLWSEIFREYDDTSRPVCVKETFVDFGSCSITKMSEKKTITVVNGADAKVQCKWVLPNQWVKIFPESADVPAGGATTFQVAFRVIQNDAQLPPGDRQKFRAAVAFGGRGARTYVCAWCRAFPAQSRPARRWGHRFFPCCSCAWLALSDSGPDQQCPHSSLLQNGHRTDKFRLLMQTDAWLGAVKQPPDGCPAFQAHGRKGIHICFESDFQHDASAHNSVSSVGHRFPAQPENV
jgi:hypothetical protein